MPRMEPTEQKVQNNPIVATEPWYKKGWRPALAWGYVAICVFDFIIAPAIMMAFFGQASATTMLPPGLLAYSWPSNPAPPSRARRNAHIGHKPSW